jgi:hypothetical protein
MPHQTIGLITLPDRRRCRLPRTAIDLDVERNLLAFDDVRHAGPFRNADVQDELVAAIFGDEIVPSSD